MVDAIGQLLAVNVVAQLHPDPGGTMPMTAIDKRPVEGLVQVTSLGVAGDRQMDTKHHGGRDQALYAFAREDVVDWEIELGHSITPGWFGENLTMEGVDVSDALVGEQWRIGGDRLNAVVVEVTSPRTPCNTFARWTGEAHWVSRFTAYGRVGAYLRVVEEGSVQAGDPVEVVHLPAHGVRVSQLLRQLDPAAGRALVDAHESGQVELADEAYRRAERAVRPRAH